MSRILHIKRHTKGTSNEISFDVLDAAREELDAKKSRKKESAGFLLDFRKRPQDNPKGHVRRNKTERLSSSHGAGVASGGKLMPVDEVGRRKKRRHRQKAVVYLMVFAAIAVGAGAVGWLSYRDYMSQQDFDAQFADLIQSVSVSDSQLVTIDDLMDDPLGNTTSEERTRARKEAVAVTSVARNALTEAGRLSKSAPADQGKTALAQVQKGAQGRLDMVDCAMQAFDESDAAAGYVRMLQQVWDSVIDTDIAAREAITQANSATTLEDLGSSTEALEDAKGAFQDEAHQLEVIQADCPDADLAPHQQYVAKRIEAVEYAIGVNNALEARDREEAAAQNQLYTDADRESANLADKLPVSINDVIIAAFKPSVDEIQAQYDQARIRVSDADALVREYLNI